MRGLPSLIRKRLFIVLIFCLVIFLIIVIRLAYVQLVVNEKLSLQAEDLWSREIPFVAKRGEIVDRNGVPLATNQSAPTIYIIPRQVKDPSETARLISEVLQIREQKAYEHITKKTSIERIPEGRYLSNEQAKTIKEYNLAGVYIAEDFKRHYPFENYLAHSLGFTGIDNQGLMGLELFYDEQLKGSNGSVKFFSSAKGERMNKLADEYVPPTDGLDLKLTIDAKIQAIIERELDLVDLVYNPDAAMAIAMNPNNGEILSLASRPSFNPAEFQEVPQEVYNRNLPIWSTYEPGSTFKIITLAAALEEDLVDLEGETFFDKGAVTIGGSRLRCWKAGGHGSQTFLEVVQNSCNPGFVSLGERLGRDKLFSYIDKFGFGKKTGIDLQGEGTGILFNLDNVGPVELATTSFGQGVSVTPIQQVAAVSAAINGGVLYKPYITKELYRGDDGTSMLRKSPVIKEQVISEETSKEVRYALESVVAKGTGRNAFVDSYRVGGKTGTAQKAVDGKYLENNHIVSFIGFAPADKPEIVVYVAIDNPKGTVQFGGTVAAPVVGRIIEDSLQVLKVDKRDNQIEKELMWFDQPLIEVPNLIKSRKEDLQNYLLDLKFDIHGQGDIVLNQSPKPGEKIPAGGTIRVYLSE